MGYASNAPMAYVHVSYPLPMPPMGNPQMGYLPTPANPQMPPVTIPQTATQQPTNAIVYPPKVPKKDKICKVCCCKGHEGKECVKADKHDCLHYYPIHDLVAHGFWKCDKINTLSKGQFEFLFLALRTNKPQYAWGENIAKMDLVLNSKPIRQPWSREYTMRKQQTDTKYWETLKYNESGSDRSDEYDRAWNDYKSMPDQTYPPYRQRRQNRRRSASPDQRRHQNGIRRERSPIRQRIETFLPLRRPEVSIKIEGDDVKEVGVQPEIQSPVAMGIYSTN
ncbi:uncharacterized protein PAC_07932 [Phialocephala subalpina]|uniref:Uncharacterized protein n=1 Tax=Phialocephala subalpina TaxID=576137 RepID=A0A1L7WZ59_9HELO|nr:uncharacterized protein PAC_07932 [Phialocephala subalpina]